MKKEKKRQKNRRLRRAVGGVPPTPPFHSKIAFLDLIPVCATLWELCSGEESVVLAVAHPWASASSFAPTAGDATRPVGGRHRGSPSPALGTPSLSPPSLRRCCLSSPPLHSRSPGCRPTRRAWTRSQRSCSPAPGWSCRRPSREPVSCAALRTARLSRVGPPASGSWLCWATPALESRPSSTISTAASFSTRRRTRWSCATTPSWRS